MIVKPSGSFSNLLLAATTNDNENENENDNENDNEDGISKDDRSGMSEAFRNLDSLTSCRLLQCEESGCRLAAGAQQGGESVEGLAPYGQGLRGLKQAKERLRHAQRDGGLLEGRVVLHARSDHPARPLLHLGARGALAYSEEQLEPADLDEVIGVVEVFAVELELLERELRRLFASLLQQYLWLQLGQARTHLRNRWLPQQHLQHLLVERRELVRLACIGAPLQLGRITVADAPAQELVHSGAR